LSAIELRYCEPAYETADAGTIRALQLERLRELLSKTSRVNDFYRNHWATAGVGDLDSIDSLEAFARRVPTVGKADFLADQNADPPFGRRHTHARSLGGPLYVATTSGTSGQGHEVHMQTQREWEGTGRVYSYMFRWAGLREGEGLALALPVTMLGGGRLEQQGADYYGLTVYPLGNYNAARKAELMNRFQPAAVIGMTAYLGRLGNEFHGQPPSATRAIISGGEGAGIEWLRRLEQLWGGAVFDRYGSTQAGNDHMFCCERGIGTAEQPAMLHNIDPHVLLEVIDPQTGAHVRAGEVGDLVLTDLYRIDAPIIRCRTGDRGVYRPPGSCACGRPFGGVEVATVGRVDDMRKIKGVNVWPLAIESVVFEYNAVADYQVVLSSGAGGQDVATLRIEPSQQLEGSCAEVLSERLAGAVERRAGIRFEIEIVDPSTVARDDWKAKRWIDSRDHITNSPFEWHVR
jgi:phenylacetate-CoA ligase